MTDAAPAADPVERPWQGRRRLLLYGLYALLGAVAAYEVVRALGDPGDFEAFVTFGEVVLRGEVPYLSAVETRHFDGGGPAATWPPSFAPLAVFLAVWSRVSHAATILGWQLVNLAGLAVVLGFCARMLYGRRLSLTPGGGRMPLLALPMAVALFVPLRLLLSNFEHEQANLLILGLAAGGFWLFRRRNRWAGGLVLGLATALKATPLVALPYLAWRGRRRDLGATVAGCVVAWGVLPAVVIGPGRLGQWYGLWLQRSRDVNLYGGNRNQSLQATLTRLLADGSPPGAEAAASGTAAASASGTDAASALGAPGAGSAVEAGGSAAEALPAALGGGEAAVVTLVVVAALTVAGAWAFGRPLREVEPRREALELGVVFSAMALLSPLAWKAHFGGLAVLAAGLFAVTPRAAPWRRAAEESGPGVSGRGEGGDRPGGESARSGGSGGAGQARAAPPGGWRARALYALLGLVFVLLNLTSHGVLGGAASDALERVGVVTWSALLMIAAGLAALARVPPGAPRPGGASPSSGGASRPSGDSSGSSGESTGSPAGTSSGRARSPETPPPP